MNKQLRSKCKQVLFSVGVATLLLSQVNPPCYLYATTVNTNASSNINTVQVKDTKLTLQGFVEDPKAKVPVISAVLERASGFPAQATGIKIQCKGKVTLNNKSYEVWLYARNFKKISDTQANVQLEVDLIEEENGVTQRAKGITAASLKNIPIALTIEEIEYTRQLSTLSEQFKAQLKKVTAIEGVTGEQAGMGYMNKGGSFIGKAGMNIPVFEGCEDIVLDNIGFVKGRLMLRTKEKNDSFLNLKVQDAADRHMVGTGVGLSNDAGMIHIYDDIKDAAALNKCKVSAEGTAVVESDKETKVLNCKL